MDEERYMVFDNKKGVLIPLKKEQTTVTEEESRNKAEKLQSLLKAMIQDTVRETMKECTLQMKEEWREHEKTQEKHWREMEDHFKTLDEAIREKQNDNKRKKHFWF